VNGAPALSLRATSEQALPIRPEQFPASGQPRQGTVVSPAYAAADRALAAKGRSFHFARRLLGAAHAERATRLYGFCRHIDDLADEAPAPDAARFTLETIAHALEVGASDDPGTRDLLEWMRQCHIDPAIPINLIRGVRSDLDPVRIADTDELLRYCYRVAGTVGLMMSVALDAHDPRAGAHAIDLGIAMQLTNLCRDVQADAEAGRRYLPASLVGELEPAQLVQPVPTLQAMLRRSVGTLLDLADTYYRSGEDGLCYLPARARYGILTALQLYRAIGWRLRARGCDPWAGRVVVPFGAKLWIAGRVMLSAPMRADLRRPGRQHDPLLHSALSGLPGAAPPPETIHAA